MVRCQIAPFIKSKEISDFLKRLEAKGKFKNFYELLKKYSTPDQNVDFKRALRENPNNENLKEYYELIKKYIKSKE